MNFERLKKIVEYSNKNRETMKSEIKQFYFRVGMNGDNEVLNIMQIVRPFCQKRGYLLLELPFADDEIGALCYKGDALGYILLNTSLPKVNINFALCHELYHIFCQEQDFRSKLEFINDAYYENEEELAANLFAGMLLMPETSFCNMYAKFKEESGGDEKETIIRLMSYYQAPYMAVLIRCYELELPHSASVPGELLDVEPEVIRSKFHELWLDDSILDATKKDDYKKMEGFVRIFGEECIRESYLNQRTLEKVLKNMRMLYSNIKEGE